MMKKEKNRKDLFEEIGRKNGVSAESVREEIEKAIMDAYNNPDPKQQAGFKKRFGDKLPTPEELIYGLAKEIKGK